MTQVGAIPNKGKKKKLHQCQTLLVADNTGCSRSLNSIFLFFANLCGYDEVFVGGCGVPLQPPVVGELPREITGVTDVHAEGIVLVDRDQVRQRPSALRRAVNLCALRWRVE